MHPSLSARVRATLLIATTLQIACGPAKNHPAIDGKDCVECHEADRNTSSIVNHHAEGFPTTCSDCHSQSAWKPATFDHASFPLIGKHAETACASCHTSTENPPTACIDCHEADRSRSQTFNHLVDGFPTDCSQCHTPVGWSSTQFDHSAFVLTGVHGTTPCASCHDRDPVPTTCVGCHEADRQRATNPDHMAPTWPTDCARCHAPTGWSVTGLACDSCHGSATNPAPPVSVTHSSTTTERGVGAHQKHLESSTWHAPVQCADCHVVPATITDPGHNDTALPAELTFSAKARADGANPQWNGTTCSGTYCHGATLSGGTTTSPVWTQVDSTQANCGSCHGMPPTENHVSDPQCSRCHDQTVDTDRNIINPSLHINGHVEVKDLQCNTCHGSATNNAPPNGVNGETATTTLAVGAHQAHLASSDWHAPIACGACHIVPTNVSDPGHDDTPLPAEVTFSDPANADHATPTWNHQQATCSNTYCHGATLSGGTATTPTWTQAWAKVDGTRPACTNCHGMPPTENHPTGTDCASCHSQVVDANQKIIAPNLHMNGTVEADDMACDSCHGSSANSAPPKGVNGETATTTLAVGAHQAHLASADWHVRFACNDCHHVPVNINDPGHQDTPLPAELTFSARAGGTSVSWNHAAATCSGSYCHGATLSGGTATTPVWTQTWTKTDGVHPSCTNCHGMPPAPPHSTSTACESCHSSVVDANKHIIAPNLHMNGTVEATGAHPAGYDAPEKHAPDFYNNPSSCTSCHGATLTGGTAPSCASCHPSNWKTDCVYCHGGTDNQTGAPPESVSGATAVTVAGVGRHTEHVTQGSTHVAWDCSLCHIKPTDALSGSHIGPSPAELTFSGLAAGSTYNFSTKTCANVYCHGNGRTSGSATWTGSLTTGCASCHSDSARSLSGEHGEHSRYSCDTCHSCVINSSNQVIDITRHVNGQRDVCGTKITSWNGTSCTNTCHGSERW